ncbi:MAG TPA: CPBP family intramembrane glutamic endopeptidase, partial [Chitinophagaceae bacterium]|nr:CPBP family intramembrane glutamic endopeptidase [Chitinophagaceae bacterium]
YAICYLAFFLISLVSKSEGGYKLFTEDGPARNTGALQGLQITGILWFGIIPFYILGIPFSEMVFGDKFPDFFPALIFILIAVALSLFALIQSQNLFGKIISYKIVFKIFSRAFIARYILLRFLFLCAYEIFFRGYLFTDSLHYLGITEAVLLNVFLYTLLHAPGNKKEMIACIPFGILLCVICIWLKAVWPAIVLHVSLSLTYEINLVRKFSKPLKAIL